MTPALALRATQSSVEGHMKQAVGQADLKVNSSHPLGHFQAQYNAIFMLSIMAISATHL